MSVYGLQKFLFAFNTDPSLRTRFKDDPASATVGFPLNDAEREALRSYDWKRLYDWGVHPLLLSALANGSGIPVPKYLEAIR